MNARGHISRHAFQIMRFLVVGGIGFVVDAVILLLLVHGARMSPVWARIPSLLIALTATWWLHRSFTFAWRGEIAPTSREWLRFVVANAFGNGLNLGVYWVLIGFLGWGILLSLTIASVVAAGINYLMSARWVFRRN